MGHYIEVTDVSKIYRQGQVKIKALDGVSFFVEKGEFCVVAGQSGAGKTTILNLLGGMDSATSGSILVDGREIVGLAANKLTTYRRHDVGFVFQFYNLVPNLTALENVELASEICKDSLSAGETLQKVGLGDRMKNFPAQLSGGEQQRVAIARALAKNPKLLLCDEPTGALDDETGRQILQLLSYTSYQTGMTVVLITHNTSIAQMAQRVIRIKSGKVSKITVNEEPKSVDEIEW